MTGLAQMRGLPLVVVLLIIGALWYVAAIGMPKRWETRNWHRDFGSG